MSGRVYLSDEVKNVTGFADLKNGDGSPKRGIPDQGITLYLDDGRWYTKINLGDQIPKVLKGVVEEISVIEFVPVYNAREWGVYRLKTARAEVSPESSGKNNCLCIKLTAKNLDDLCELFHQIKVGSIRPLPEDSYEGPQDGTSWQQLLADNVRLQGVNDDLRAQVEALTKQVNEVPEELAKLRRQRQVLTELCHEYWDRMWPWCRKVHVGFRLAEIIDYHPSSDC